MVNRRPRMNKRHRPKAEAEAAETGGEMNDDAEQDERRWIMLKNNGRVKRAGRTDRDGLMLSFSSKFGVGLISRQQHLLNEPAALFSV